MSKNKKNKKMKPEALLAELIYPTLLYYVMTLLIMYAARGVFGNDSANYMACQLMVGVILLPVMYLAFYRPDTLVWGRAYAMEDRKITTVCFLLLSLLLIGSGLNNLLVMSPLAGASAGYQEANENFYGSTFLIELLASGLLAPLLEEVTFRGIIYGRARRIFGVRMGLVISALIFAIIHFNPVQFIYAFFMGLLLGILLERTGSLAFAAIGHMLINVLAICRTELGWLESTVNGSTSAWIVSCVLLLSGLIILAGDLKNNFQTIFKTSPKAGK